MIIGGVYHTSKKSVKVALLYNGGKTKFRSWELLGTEEGVQEGYDVFGRFARSVFRVKDDRKAAQPGVISNR